MILPKYRSLLSQTEIELIHEKTLYLLKNKGMLFDSDEAIEIFRNAGFKADGKIVYFSEEQVNNALKTAPKSYTLWGANSHVEIKNNANIIMPFTGPITVYEDDVYREPNVDDYLNFTKLSQSSDITQTASTSLFAANVFGNDKLESAKKRLAMTMAYSDKPLQSFAEGKESAEMSFDFIRKFTGISDPNKIIAYAHCSTDAPFKISKNSCETQIAYARAGQLVRGNTGGMPGVSTPASFAGVLLQSNTERLASLIFTQTINEGSPHIMGTSPLLADLRFASGVTGSPDCALFSMAQKDMVDYYGIPCMGHGILSDAKGVDFQAGVESMMNGFAVAYSEYAMMNVTLGSMNSYLSVSYEKYVLDEEIYRIIKKLRSPITIDEESLKVEHMMYIEHAGDYVAGVSDELMEDYFGCYRQDFYRAKLFSQEPQSAWEIDGSKSTYTRAKEEVKQRLENFKIPEYTSEQKAMVNAFLDDKYKIL